MELNMSFKILRIKEVIALTGLSRSSIYLKIAQGTFPVSIRLSKRAVGWRETDLHAWIDSLESTKAGFSGPEETADA